MYLLKWIDTWGTNFVFHTFHYKGSLLYLYWESLIILRWTSKSIGLLFLCNVVSWFGFVLFQSLFADSTNHIKWNNYWYYCILGTRERGQEHHSQCPSLGHSSPPTTISVRRSSFCFHLSSPLVAQKNIYILNLFWSKSIISMIK